MSPTSRRGAAAEQQAADWLQRRGLRVIERNARSRFGELDLLALDGETLVIVEVRARAPSRFGGAAETVDARKQGRILRSTQDWLLRHPEHARRAVRFDVLAIDGATPQWIRGAFDAGTLG